MHAVQTIECKAFQRARIAMRGAGNLVVKCCNTKCIIPIHHHTCNNRSNVKIESALECSKAALSNALTM